MKGTKDELSLHFSMNNSHFLSLRYSGLLLRGLSHPSPRVQTLAVAQLARSAQDEDLAAQLVQRDLVSPAFELLAGDLAVATEVTNMAIGLGIVF